MKIKFITSLLLLAVCTTHALALFDTTYWGVRALGMGGAFTAVSNDSNAPVYNIAGTADMEKAEVTFMSAKLLVGEDGYDLGTDYFAFIFPVSKKIGSFSIGWAYFGDAGLRREDTVNFGYARGLNDILQLPESIIDLKAGFNIKYLRQEARYRGSDVSQDAIGVDIGLLARLPYGISLGYSGKYFNSPDIGVFMEDKIKQINTFGVSYFTEELPFLKIPLLTVAMDYEMRSGDNTLMFGAESRIIDGDLALRAGGWKEQLNFGIGYTLDIGKSKLMLDYAFGLPLEVQDTSGSHFLSLTFQFP